MRYQVHLKFNDVKYVIALMAHPLFIQAAIDRAPIASGSILSLFALQGLSERESVADVLGYTAGHLTSVFDLELEHVTVLNRDADAPADGIRTRERKTLKSFLICELESVTKGS